jgi:hypothetical protein
MPDAEAFGYLYLWVCEIRSLNRYLLLIAIVLAAVVFLPDPSDSRVLAHIHDLAHAPIFGFVAVLMLRALPGIALTSKWSVAAQYAVAIAVSAGLGLATEIVQAFVGRDASWGDLQRDVLGSVAFAALFTAVDPRVDRAAIRRAGCIVGIALMLFHLFPFAKTTVAYKRRNESFPVLFEARDPTPDHFAGAMRSLIAYEPLPTAFASYPNEQALHVRFKSGPWLGMYVKEPYPDWRGYRALALDLTNASSQPLWMALHIQDRAHDQRYEDRFNKHFTLAPQTRTTLVIPLAEIERGPVARKLNLRKMDGLVLFTSEQHASQDVYVSRIWLQ